MKYRVRFAKYGVMRYVGHLDLMRFFQKALNRANIPLSYSKGFHPHPLISFAAPLSVGVTSCGEYMDVVTESAVNTDEACLALDRQMVDGMRIVSVTELPEKAKNAMASVEAAAYYVYFKSFDGSSVTDTIDLNLAGFSAAIHSFYHDASSIPVTKQTKKSELEIDLKPLIYDFHVMTVGDARETGITPFSNLAARQASDASHSANMDVREGVLPVSEEERGQFCLSDDDVAFYMELSCGSTDNVKPELLMERFLSSMKIPPDAYRLGIHRIDMFRKNGVSDFVSLGDGR